MSRTIIFLAVYVTLGLVLNGCGGGSSSSTSDSNTSSSSSSSSAPNAAPPSSGFSSLEINPLKDLGLTTGDQVCFSVKSYNNVTESDFSKAICGKINNSTELTLSWNKTSGNVTGYYIYFGSNKNNATNFLADVIES